MVGVAPLMFARRPPARHSTQSCTCSNAYERQFSPAVLRSYLSFQVLSMNMYRILGICQQSKSLHCAARLGTAREVIRRLNSVIDIMNTRAAQQQCNSFSVGPVRSVDDPQLRELVETLCFFQASLTIYLSGVVTGSCGDILCC